MDTERRMEDVEFGTIVVPVVMDDSPPPLPPPPPPSNPGPLGRPAPKKPKKR